MFFSDHPPGELLSAGPGFLFYSTRYPPFTTTLHPFPSPSFFMRKFLLENQPEALLRAGASSARRLRHLGTGLLLLGSLGAQAQLVGNKAIPGAGATGYATLAAAIADLNAQGVGTGGVTFSLAPGYAETAANLLVTASGTAANPVVFQKGAGAGANPTITAAAGTSATLDCIIGLQGADYVTFDGLTLVDPAGNTGAGQMEWGFALLKAGTPAVDGCQHVTIRNCVVALQKGPLTVGIYANNHTPAAATQLVPTAAAGTNSNNRFYGNTISRVNSGVFVAGYAAPSPYALYDQGNEVGSVLSGTAPTGSNIADYGTAATAYGIYAAFQHGVAVQGNTVNSAPAAGGPAATGLLYGIFVGTGGSADVLGNTLTVSTGTTTSSTYGIQSASGANGLNGAATTVNLTNNSLTLTSATATTAAFFGLYNTGAAASLNLTGNTISNWSRVGTGTSYGLYVGTGATATQNVTGNTVSNLALGGLSGSTYCIYSFNSATANVVFADNAVTNVTSGGPTVYGLYTSSGATVDVLRNRIAALSTASTSTTTALYGLYVGSGTAVGVTNNLVGDLTAPGGGNAGLAVIGLYLGGGTTLGAQFNSVHLNATSTAANFGTAGIYYTSSATTAVSLRNNVVVNTSAAAGTGLTSALRRSSGAAGTAPANLSANHNLYYAGTPSATNLIYAEGFSSTSPYVNQQQTLADYRSFVAGREANSVTESPVFVSTAGTNANFLKVSTTTPTQVESGGAPVGGITTDYAGTARSAAFPDLGAYEGTYPPLDLTGPAIALAALANTSSTANRTVVATIADPSGVATGANAPRLYYRRGAAGAFVFANATGVSGSQYTFTFDYALLPGGVVAAGDVVQYYVAAQDQTTPPNAGTSPGGGSGATPPGTTAPAVPGAFQIVGSLSGTYYVGTSAPPAGTPANRVFATLTAAANAYSLNVLTGPTTFLLLDAAYSTAETFPVTFGANASASAANTLLVAPAAGVSPVVTGSGAAPAVVLIAGASYLTLEGANAAGGTARNLTLAGANPAAGAVVWVGSLGASAGATNVTLRNLNVVGGNAANAGSFGIYASAAPATAASVPSAFTYGDNNDNLVIQNNAVTNAYEAIFARANGVATAYDGLQIVENRIGTAPSGVGGPVSVRGIDVQGAAGPLIARNVILGLNGTAVATSIAGIELNANVTNAVVSRNAIGGLRQLNPGGWGAYGISLATTTNITNAEISNNVIADVQTAAYTSSTTFNPFGIRLTGGTGTRVYYNAVNLFGTIAPTASSPTPNNISAGLIVSSGSATGLDVRNNVFANATTTTATAGTVKAYAAYYTTAASLATSDHNDYYVSGPNGVLGYVGTDVTTLAALRTATAKDGNSLSTDPIFATATNLLPASGPLANGGTPVAVTVDYTGAPRPAAAPSIGAYQFTPQPIDVAPNALVSPVNSSPATCFGANTPVVVQVRNNGSSVLDFASNPLTLTVVIGGPGGSTQTLTQTLGTGTLASAATQNLTLTALADFTPLGGYTFGITATVTGDLNTGNDLLAPAPALAVAAPVAGALSQGTLPLCVSGATTLTLAGAANGTIQYQQSSSATGPFANIAGANAPAYTTPTLSSTTYYRAQVTCGAAVATSNVSTVTVNNPVILAAPSPLSTCAGGTATLSATVPAGVSVRYFATATGGTAVGAGSPFVTPALTATTTYYAEAFAGGTENVGKPSTNGADGTNTSGGLYFTATGPTAITSVTVYRAANAAAGTATVYLLPGSTSATAGALATATVPVPANPTAAVAPTVLTLNFAVPAAGPYTLYLGAATPALVRDFSSAVPAIAYPYASPSGAVTITDATLTGFYYFFYNWQLGSECTGASRTAIQVNVTPGLVASLPVAAASSCGRAPYPLSGTIAGTATGALYTSSGTGAFAPSATTLNATYTPSAADVAAGTVTLTLTPTGPAAPCTSTGQVVLTLATPPNAAFGYPAGAYCTGAAATVAPVIAAGAVVGTFTASGFGLRLDPVTGVVNLATSTGTGTYTITNTVVTAGVCSGTTATATITINSGVATPTLAATPQAGGAVLLSTTAIAGVTFQFFRNGVAVGPPGGSSTLLLTTGTQNGAYTVVLATPQGCASAPSAPVTVTVTGTQTATLNGVSLLLYPNPTPDGRLTLELRGARAAAAPLRVLNALGQVVRTTTLAVGTSTLDLSALVAGVYTVRVQTPQGVLTQRVMRE